MSRKNEHAEWVLGVRKCIIFGTGLGRAAACRLRGQFSKVNHHGMMPIFWSISRVAKMEHFLDPNHHALLRSRVVKNEVRTDRHTDGHEYVGADEPKMEGKNGAVVWGRGVKKVRFDLRLGGSPIGRLKSRVCKGFSGQKEGPDDCSNTREKWSSLRSLPTRLSADEPRKESSLFFIFRPEPRGVPEVRRARAYFCAAAAAAQPVQCSPGAP